jgi:hypothetical protein
LVLAYKKAEKQGLLEHSGSPPESFAPGRSDWFTTVLG